jgi:hypothetical protein
MMVSSVVYPFRIVATAGNCVHAADTPRSAHLLSSPALQAIVRPTSAAGGQAVRPGRSPCVPFNEEGFDLIGSALKRIGT